MPYKRNIIILSVSAGSGHIRAAEALRSAFQTEDPALEVNILDTFRYASPLMEKLMLGTYMEMLRHTPSLYGYIYRQSEKGRPLSGFAKNEFSRILSTFSASSLVKYIEQHSPEVVICTHPFPLGVLSALRKRGKFNYLIVGAITDLTIHPYWVFPEVDFYFVGADRLAEDLIDFGIQKSRVYATGIPIDPVFSRREDRKAVIQGLDLDENLPTLLIMGGGLGLGPLEESVRALGYMDLRCQIIIVTGNNLQLKEKLDQLVPGLPNRVFTLGYTDSIHQLMAAADIMVSKAGGLSCSEAVASKLPLFIMNPLPGQEERNTQFLVSAGAAVAVSSVENLVDKITYYIMNPLALKEMSSAAARLGRPEAAIVAAALIKQRILNRSALEFPQITGADRGGGVLPSEGNLLYRRIGNKIIIKR